MSEITQKPSAGRAFSWFDPRWRDISTWGFILNRITAIGLTVYLFIHLAVLGQLARGQEGYDSFLTIVKQPFFIFLELLVVIGALIHGLNGIRIALNSFGVAVRYQKALLVALMTVALVGSAYFGIRMFSE